MRSWPRNRRLRGFGRFSTAPPRNPKPHAKALPRSQRGGKKGKTPPPGVVKPSVGAEAIWRRTNKPHKGQSRDGGICSSKSLSQVIVVEKRSSQSRLPIYTQTPNHKPLLPAPTKKMPRRIPCFRCFHCARETCLEKPDPRPNFFTRLAEALAAAPGICASVASRLNPPPAQRGLPRPESAAGKRAFWCRGAAGVRAACKLTGVKSPKKQKKRVQLI